jgi:hypothetical protein
MKGLEVTFNGRKTSVAVDEHLCMSIIIEKIGDNLKYSFSGMEVAKCLYLSWDFANELKLGDEIVVRKKEIDTNSAPIHTQQQAPWPSKEEALQYQLKRFQELEVILKGKGLIE